MKTTEIFGGLLIWINFYYTLLPSSNKKCFLFFFVVVWICLYLILNFDKDSANTEHGCSILYCLLSHDQITNNCLKICQHKWLIDKEWNNWKHFAYSTANKLLKPERKKNINHWLSRDWEIRFDEKYNRRQ